ncbi:MAG: CDP-alcohol phosphatidyltransferase family protein [Methanobrevibacter sp.]|uniref:CDP-alcohol phosphatidyltransferase family protein n=1 Tax=Methanobrevibacter sp. TaxID=66852 RepID=UPI0025CEF49E|nr:CDP-alcohol phosphatidyltransferase family protein [Methanobrevibacter sp.]MBQ6100556.1 CDP-alcohol phosphatidyltransferase family protein [Methanobrevibacter sp.]MBR0372035.1 CDP-alcohol phosphatidyltransferase family protein [Methanobrevibacter sp.]
MNKIHINILTSLRIILGLLFLYFTIVQFNIYYLIFIFILTAISDNLDGILARRFKLTTDNGAKFDVICDFIFIMLSTLAGVLINLIPFWFLFVIILKLIEFFKTSKGDFLTYDKFGHLVSLMFYAFPIVAILINSKTIVLILTLFITICAVISSILRIGDRNDFA